MAVMTPIRPWQIEVLFDERPPRDLDGTRDGRYLYWFADAPGTQIAMAVNGRRGAPFDDVLRFADGRTSSQSPAGTRFAYCVRRARDAWVGVDDGEFGPFEDLSQQTEPTFSPDDRHIVWAAKDGDDVRLLVDGAIIPNVHPAAAAPSWSPDGRRFAYTAARMDGGRLREWVVIDGTAEPEADGIGGSVVFSPDGTRLAYPRHVGNEWCYVIDGAAEPPFAAVGAGVFSPDGKRFAYPASDGADWFLVEGNERGERHAGVVAPVFSPDSTRTAYLTRDRDGLRAVVDGVASRGWSDLTAVTFSPDGRRAGYVALEKVGGFLRQKTMHHLVVDGDIGPAWDDSSGDPRFASDGRVAIAASTGGRWSLFVDGTPIHSAENVAPPMWSATDRLGFVISDGRTSTVIVDGKAGPAMSSLRDFEGSAAETGVFFLFSPDGSRIVYQGDVNGTHSLVLDGQVGPPLIGTYPVFGPGGVTIPGVSEGRIVRATMGYPGPEGCQTAGA